MKKIIALFTLVLTLFTFSSCYGKKESPLENETLALTDEEMLITGVVCSGARTNSLLVSSEKYGMLDVDISSAEFKSGEITSFKDVKNGMTVSFSCTEIMETYPGMTSATQITADTSSYLGDLYGLYCEVIKEMWENDSALNDNGENLYLNVPFTPEISSEVIDALAYYTGNLTGKIVTLATIDDLKEQKIFDESALYINGGCYLEIKGEFSSDNKMTFNVQKYVGGLGAVFYTDCTAEMQSDGTWEYEIGGFAIA